MVSKFLTASNFKKQLGVDIWLIEKFLQFPCEPKPEIKGDPKNGWMIVEIHESLTLQDQLEAVRNYRKIILPAIFITVQKVYAEFFRLVLANNRRKAKSTQSYVEKELTDLIKLNPNFVITPPFSNISEFRSWWNGYYDYNKLRKARNKIVHDEYSYDGKELIVKLGKNVQLRWNDERIIEYARSVLEIVKRI